MRSQSISSIAEQGSESPIKSVYDAEDAYEMTPRTTDSTGSAESDSGSIPSSMDSSQSNSFSFGNNNNVLSSRSHERIAIALNSPVPQRVNRNKNQTQDREQMLSSVLRRSNSVPFLNSWEYGNIDVDLHLPFVGTFRNYSKLNGAGTNVKLILARNTCNVSAFILLTLLLSYRLCIWLS